MKFRTYKKGFAILFAIAILTAGCSEDFLNRPPESAYTADNFYQDENQIELAVNPLYGGVWFDYQRSFINIGDVMAGNIHRKDNPYYIYGLTASNTQLADAYNSLWTAVAYCNGTIENIREKSPSSIDESIKNKFIGEALVWKAMAYFYLVRIWGAIPIIESNTRAIQSGNANSLYRNRIEDVYEYIIRTLHTAVDLLPGENETGRINRYSAYGLLAKVYLTRSGYNNSGSRNQEDLDKAREYAGIVAQHYAFWLEPVYMNLFTLSKGNRNRENLISWHWVVVANSWGSQNALQADLAVQQLTGHGDGWGTWDGPSINLQQLFGEDATKLNAGDRVNNDARRKATMMMNGDHYSELKQSEGGLTVFWDGGSVFASNSGAWARKHIVGHFTDHEREIGYPSAFMQTSLSTHLLRLADIYLVYAEAILGNNASTSDPEALQAYNAVKSRSIIDYTPVNSITFDSIMDERRRELAYEGDNWFDFVRLHYYNPADAIERIQTQERGQYSGNAKKPEELKLNSFYVTILDKDFELPFPEIDISINPNLIKDPVPYDFGD